MGKSKFSEQQKDEIRKMYATGKYSIRALGRYFNVSHGSLDYILFPERIEKRKEYHKQHWINNKERLSKQHKEYYENNKDFVREMHRKYNITNYEKNQKKHREYDRNNKAFFIYIKKDEIQLVENYSLAKADDFIGWVTHHKLETHNSDGELREVEITPEELKALGMYYERPANELCFLTRSEHMRLHNIFVNKQIKRKRELI